MHLARHMRNTEFGPTKWPPLDFKMQIRIAFIVCWDNSIDPHGWWKIKMVRFNCAGDFRTDRSCDNHGISSAETIGQVNGLGAHVESNSFSAHVLSSILGLRSRQQQKMVAILNGCLQTANLLAAEREIGHRYRA